MSSPGAPLEGQVGLGRTADRYLFRCSDCPMEFVTREKALPLLLVRLLWHLHRRHRLGLAEAAQLIAESHEL
jgi:hypothetical protein